MIRKIMKNGKHAFPMCKGLCTGKFFWSSLFLISHTHTHTLTYIIDLSIHMHFFRALRFTDPLPPSHALSLFPDSLSLKRTFLLSLPPAHTLTYTHSPPHTHTPHTHTHTHTNVITHAHTLSYTYKNNNTHTHVHTYTPSSSLPLTLPPL